MQKESPFDLMNRFFLGLVISFAYGVLSTVLLLCLEGQPDAKLFLTHYNISFNTLISLGLILGIAIIVFKSQNIVPDTIQEAFPGALANEKYLENKARFLCGRRSVEFSLQFAGIALAIFYLCRFPLPGLARCLMIIPACAQYAFGVYVGRKLFYAAMMLHSLLGMTVSKDVFKKRELDDINTYVHIVSTLMIIFGFSHLLAYYEGPFLFNGWLGDSARVFLMVPVLIGTPVLLIFNFYPRLVIRKLYRQSIDFEIERLRKLSQSEKLSPFEEKSYLFGVREDVSR